MEAVARQEIYSAFGLEARAIQPGEVPPGSPFLIEESSDGLTTAWYGDASVDDQILVAQLRSREEMIYEADRQCRVVSGVVAVRFALEEAYVDEMLTSLGGD